MSVSAFLEGFVARSRDARRTNASCAEQPHISSDGCSLLHTSGRSGLPKSLQRLSLVRGRQRTPAGLPFAIPGRADEMDGAIQHAPQPIRQSMGLILLYFDLCFSRKEYTQALDVPPCPSP